MDNEALSRKGFYDVANDTIDYADMKELMMMDYLTKKLTIIRKRLKKTKEIVDKFNEDVDTAKSINIHQNISGEPLKKIELNVKYNFN